MKTITVFLIDDDEQILSVLTELLSDHYAVQVFKDSMTAYQAILESPPHIVISDIKMQGMDGIQLLKAVKEDVPEVIFLLMSGHTTTTLAIEAIQFGAVDYINKPFENQDVLDAVNKAVEYADMRTTDSFRKILDSSIHSKRSERLVGTNPKMLDIYKTIGRIAGSRSNVLITGESGTGKELIARTIAQMSNIPNKKFMTVNCSAIPGTLFESELFGYEKGSFTGADRRKIGKVEACDGGLLFLDEIDTLPLLMQSKILRLIQQKEFQRVGGVQTLKTDVSIIAAVKADIMDQVKRGAFKEDLYYRLSVIRIDMPPLRERRDDVVEMFNYFLTENNRKHGKKIRSVSSDLLQKIKQYDWPGNVRELENAVERAVILAGEGLLTVDHFPFLMEEQSRTSINDTAEELLRSAVAKSLETGQDGIEGVLYSDLLAAFEKALFGSVLEKVAGNQVQAARLLGVSRNTLRDRIKRFDLDQVPLEGTAAV